MGCRQKSSGLAPYFWGTMAFPLLKQRKFFPLHAHTSLLIQNILCMHIGIFKVLMFRSVVAEFGCRGLTWLLEKKAVLKAFNYLVFVVFWVLGLGCFFCVCRVWVFWLVGWFLNWIYFWGSFSLFITAKMNVGFSFTSTRVLLRHSVSQLLGGILPRGFMQKSKVWQPMCKSAIAWTPGLCSALGRAGVQAGHETTGDAWSTVSVSAEPLIRLVMKNLGLVNLVLLWKVALPWWSFHSQQIYCDCQWQNQLLLLLDLQGLCGEKMRCLLQQQGNNHLRSSAYNGAHWSVCRNSTSSRVQRREDNERWW